MQLLGTGTCQLLPEKAASSVLMNFDGLNVVYDMGRGVATRLTELGIKQNDIKHIVLSHFHPDHWSDLIPYLHGASWSQLDKRTVDLNIYGPTGLRGLFNKVFDIFDENEIVRSEFFAVNFHEINTDSFKIDNYDFEYIHLPPANNHGLKFEKSGKIYALTGDSNFHPKEVAFLSDVDVAVIDSGHLTDDEIIGLAVKSRAKRIICSHQYRKLIINDLNSKAVNKGYKGTIELGKDFLKIKL